MKTEIIVFEILKPSSCEQQPARKEIKTGEMIRCKKGDRIVCIKNHLIRGEHLYNEHSSMKHFTIPSIYIDLTFYYTGYSNSRAGYPYKIEKNLSYFTENTNLFKKN